MDYPSVEILSSNHLHQFDILGPRYLKNDGRFYSANIIDAYDRRCSVNPERRKNRIAITKALIRCWQTLGIPTYLQMDNILSTRGSNRYPHSLLWSFASVLHWASNPSLFPSMNHGGMES